MHNTYGVEKRGDKYVVKDAKGTVTTKGGEPEVFDTENKAKKRALELNSPKSTVFEEFGISPGSRFDPNVPSDAANNRSYITYVFRDSDAHIVYVGRGSGPGTPQEVLEGRIRKGHDHFHVGPTPEVVDAQMSKLASQGAEEVFKQEFIEQGAQLTYVDEALSFDRKSRAERSVDKIEAYLEDLRERGLR